MPPSNRCHSIVQLKSIVAVATDQRKYGIYKHAMFYNIFRIDKSMRDYDCIYTLVCKHVARECSYVIQITKSAQLPLSVLFIGLNCSCLGLVIIYFINQIFKIFLFHPGGIYNAPLLQKHGLDYLGGPELSSSTYDPSQTIIIVFITTDSGSQLQQHPHFPNGTDFFLCIDCSLSANKLLNIQFLYIFRNDYFLPSLSNSVQNVVCVRNHKVKTHLTVDEWLHMWVERG